MRDLLQRFHPGSFVMVMASGITAIATYDEGLVRLGWALYLLSLVLYGALWLLTLIRLATDGRTLLGGLTEHQRSYGFLNVVAGTCVLGVAAATLGDRLGLAAFLWVVGGALWLVFSYTLLAALMIGAQKAELETDIHVGWLLVVVSVQTVAILGIKVAPVFGAYRAIAGIALCSHLLGVLLYALIVPLILNRMIFYCVTPEALTPISWVNMGAIACTALAGSMLTVHGGHLPFITYLGPFLKAESLLFWTGATWWIPMLVIFGLWRHGVRRYPVGYTDEYWSMVFPLGTYTVCSRTISVAGAWPFMDWLPSVFVWITFAAWIVVALGMLRRAWLRILRRPGTGEPPEERSP